MSKHTAGPWRMGKYQFGRVVAGAGVHVAEATIHKNKDITDSNVRLIAAAPELLEALGIAIQIIKNEYPPEQWNDYRVDKMDAAIAKAGGLA